MKPRIRLFRRVWDCTLPDYYVTRVIGFGFTPAAAYDEWARAHRRFLLSAAA